VSEGRQRGRHPASTKGPDQRPPEVKGDGKNMSPRRLSPRYPHLQSAQMKATQLIAVAMPKSHTPFVCQKPLANLLRAALI
jgi:hypothetical protein